MLEEIIGTICDYSNEKIKLTKGMAALALLCSFVVGVATGLVAAKIAFGKKLAVYSSALDDEGDFDADEYVRNLDFGKFGDDE